MLHNLTGWHAVIIIAIILLLFGSAKLPALAKSLGQSARILKQEAANGRAPDAAPVNAAADAEPAASVAAPASVASPAPETAVVRRDSSA